MPNREYNTIRIPDWLRKTEQKNFQGLRTTEGFLDKTLRHILSIIEDTIFNEKASKMHGLLQSINPLLKILTFLIFLMLIALMKSPIEIAPFLILGIFLVILSRLSLLSVLKRVLPLILLTFLIALPASLNIVVKGKEIFILYTFKSSPGIFGFQRIAITEEGLISMLTLIMRVSCSVLFVILLTTTTRPDRFVKSLTVFVPGVFRSIIGITYRYIFFLVRKVEEFVMGLESRRLNSVRSSGGRKWVASRIGLLFSISMQLSKELSLAMQSRGYHEKEDRKSDDREQKLNDIWHRSSDSLFNIRHSSFQLINIAWFIFSMVFDGLIIWKFLI
ncbi:MAG: energy-coupling factor transporter transmembrane component T family protein [Thermodesulfovibrionales bacterium]